MQVRRWVKRAIIVLAIIIGITALWWQMNSQQQVIRLHGNTYHMTVLREPDELTRGLSGTESLGQDQAMLFVFPQVSKWAIWMKDMNYPIDIVWLDSDGQVVYLVKDAQPSSYPKTQFTPDKPARYVIELPSGTIERTGIVIGDPAGLPSGV
jgi:uncharacterized membrane protein (UPF0127 family)